MKFAHIKSSKTDHIIKALVVVFGVPFAVVTWCEGQLTNPVLGKREKAGVPCRACQDNYIAGTSSRAAS